MIKIMYNSPAVPQKPYDFQLDKEYTLEKKNGKYVFVEDTEKDFNLDFIKSMFKVCDGCSWDMLEEVKEKEVINLNKKNNVNNYPRKKNKNN